jgi:hypothetical protein
VNSPTPAPTATSFPSGCRETAIAWSNPPKSVVTTPPEPKVVSSEPDGVYRTTAKSRPLVPATTILPSGCTSTSEPESIVDPKSLRVVPPLANEVSSVPSAL